MSDIGDIGDPDAVRSGGGEVPFQRIRSRRPIGVTPSGPHLPASVATHEACAAHEAGDAFAATANPVVVGEFGVNAWRAVVAARLGVDPFDDRGVRGVHDPPVAGWSFAPGVEPLAGDAEPVAHELDREVGLLRFDEGEHLHLVGVFFAAKKAAAFSSRSFSILNTRFSERSRFSSAFSSVVSALLTRSGTKGSQNEGVNGTGVAPTPCRSQPPTERSYSEWMRLSRSVGWTLTLPLPPRLPLRLALA